MKTGCSFCGHKKPSENYIFFYLILLSNKWIMAI